MRSTFVKYIVYTLLLFVFVACDSNKKQQHVIEVIELDQLPMYGSTPEYGNLQKTSEQLEADKEFLASSDKLQPSRKQACIDYVEMGWFYLKQGDTETAMRRANQAWQLNNKSADPYILFAAILNAREDNAGAIDMLDKAIEITPNNIAIYDMYLSESMDVHRQIGDITYLKKLLRMLDIIDPANDAESARIDKIRQDAELYLK